MEKITSLLVQGVGAFFLCNAESANVSCRAAEDANRLLESASGCSTENNVTHPNVEAFSRLSSELSAAPPSLFSVGSVTDKEHNNFSSPDS